MDATLPGLLKRTMLTKPPSTPFSLSVQPVLLYLTYSVALPANCEYVVNFAPELSEIIAEARKAGVPGAGPCPECGPAGRQADWLPGWP